MSTIVLPAVIGLVFAITGFAWWPWVIRHGEPSWKKHVARRFDVEITIGRRGHWSVDEGGVRGFLIELLQLAGYMAAFVVWASWIGLGLVIIHFLES